MADSIVKRYIDDDGARASQQGGHLPRVDFKLADGRRIGFLYSHLVWMTFKPNEGIKLHFSDHEVTLKGYNLEMLYRGIAAHEIPEVVAISKRHDVEEDRPSTPVVTDIAVLDKPGTENEGRSPFPPLDQ